MLQALEAALALFAVVIGLEIAARRIALPSPFLLLPAGIVLGFLPGFPHFQLDPDLVMQVFLPLLVYAGAALGSWVDFRRNLAPIAWLAVGCVLFTTAVVAVAAHAFLPGFGWPAAFVLGAIVSPPDEVAAISIARRLGIPKDMSAVLEGEGLVNDAASLTIYRVAVAAMVTHSFSAAGAAGTFSLIVAGEIAWGLAIGWGMLKLRKLVNNTSLEICLSLLTPFVAYLPAERLGGTGVLATVCAGLYVSYMNSHVVGAVTRLQLVPIWGIIEFILDGVLFLTAGIQLHRILEPLSSVDHRLLFEYGCAVSALVIVLRILWVFAATYLPKLIKPAFCPLRPDVRWPRVFVVSWSGMRGAVSLAAALSIPLAAGAGMPFPGRDLIIFLTFCVIVATLILQGLSLPWIIRRFKIDLEGRRERSASGHQEVEARHRTAEAALAYLADLRSEGGYPDDVLDRLEEQYRHREEQFRAHIGGDHGGAIEHGTHHFNVQTGLIKTERKVMLKLRNEGKIDDDILRRLEKDLDLQEMRLRQGISEWSISADERLGYD
ncbi:MAG TPA: Na+/H+ antiporter [Elusimicrobiota bacterium]|nr:Na+/H+ antiporter [Elusimicrobiota bacterium]